MSWLLMQFLPLLFLRQRTVCGAFECSTAFQTYQFFVENRLNLERIQKVILDFSVFSSYFIEKLLCGDFCAFTHTLNYVYNKQQIYEQKKTR